MSRWDIYRLDSTDGTNNFFSWFLVFAGICFFIFCVICGSLLTPSENIPQIVMFFFTGGAALVASFYSLFKLLIFRKIRMSRVRSPNDAETSMDSNLRVLNTNLIPRTDPWPINETPSTPQSSLSPTLSLQTRPSPTDSLLGLNSDDSLKSRSWRFLPSECRFRRAFSCDSSVSPYAYGTFPTVESATESAAANEAASSSSTQVKHPVYAVPNKTVSKKGIPIPISGAFENQDSNHNLDSSYSSCSSSLVKLPTCTVPNKGVLKNDFNIARSGSGIIANKDSNYNLESSYNRSSSSLVINPLYAVPNKVVLGTDLTIARSRSGLVEPPDFHYNLGSSCSSCSSSDKTTVIENGNSLPVRIQSSDGDSSENDGPSFKPNSSSAEIKDYNASVRKLKQKRRDKKRLSEVLLDRMVKKPQVGERESKSKQESLKSILRVPSNASEVSAFEDQLQSESYGNI